MYGDILNITDKMRVQCLVRIWWDANSRTPWAFPSCAVIRCSSEERKQLLNETFHNKVCRLSRPTRSRFLKRDIAAPVFLLPLQSLQANSHVAPLCRMKISAKLGNWPQINVRWIKKKKKHNRSEKRYRFDEFGWTVSLRECVHIKRTQARREKTKKTRNLTPVFFCAACSASWFMFSQPFCSKCRLSHRRLLH